MTTSVELRRARLEDSAEMARLAEELGYATSADAMHRRLAKLIDDDRHYIAVLADGGRLLGWMHVEHRVSLEGGDRAELMGLVVDSAARRLGLGRQLVRVAEKWAIDRGLRSLAVRSNAARVLSHPFYESLGFSRSKTQHVYSKVVATD